MSELDSIAERTLLIMTPIGVPLYSARGLTQTLTPCPEAKPTPMRTINGEARFVGGSQMRKYDSVITCTDQEAPPFSGLWPGDTVVVQCVCTLSYHTDTGSPERTVVRSYTVGAFTIYYPEITFMVVDFNDSYQEYQHEHGWQLTLIEK
jgi:hypothetical protein